MLRPALARWEALGRPLPHLPRGGAVALIALLIAATALSIPAASAITALSVDRDDAVQEPSQAAAVPASVQGSNGDLALYARIVARVAAGEGYYAAAMDEQRAAEYPTRPFVAVRLPTLALLAATFGLDAMRYLAGALLAAALLALQTRFAGEANPAERVAALLLLVLGGAVVVVPQVGLIHEAYAGLLLTLALLLYRPHRWWPALLAAGCALAVRELAVPFVLLWLAWGVAAARWREVAGVAGLLALFALAMSAHYLGVEAGRLPGDPASQGWQAFAGYGLPIRALVELTPLALLPPRLGLALAVLPLLGWFALGGRLGLFASLWFVGMLCMMALFARPENFYWAQLVLPSYVVGFALAPRALIELGRGALALRER